jgi:putative heme-binding domain-containing protein
MSRRLFSDWSSFRNALPVIAAIQKALETPVLRRPALALVEELGEGKYGPTLAKLAADESLEEDLRVVAVGALGGTAVAEYVPVLQELSRKGSLPIRQAALRAIGAAKPAGWENQFQQILIGKDSNEIRSEALRVMVQSQNGAERVLALERAQELPAELRTLASNLLNANRDPVIRREAARVLPQPVSRNKTKLPPVRSLVARQGDVAAGRKVFSSKTGADCASCHALEAGKPTVGPSLAAIGDKLGKEGMVDAILNPSAGVAHEYVTWILDTKSQGQVIGILAEDTPQRVVVKTETGGPR